MPISKLQIPATTMIPPPQTIPATPVKPHGLAKWLQIKPDAGADYRLTPSLQSAKQPPKSSSEKKEIIVKRLTISRINLVNKALTPSPPPQEKQAPLPGKLNAAARMAQPADVDTVQDKPLSNRPAEPRGPIAEIGKNAPPAPPPPSMETLRHIKLSPPKPSIEHNLHTPKPRTTDLKEQLRQNAQREAENLFTTRSRKQAEGTSPQEISAAPSRTETSEILEIPTQRPSALKAMARNPEAKLTARESMVDFLTKMHGLKSKEQAALEKLEEPRKTSPLPEQPEPQESEEDLATMYPGVRFRTENSTPDKKDA